MQKQTSQKIWLVGGSEGIGFELAKEWLQVGHQLVVSSRNAETSDKLLALHDEYGQQLKLINIDVTNIAEIPIKTQQAIDAFEGLDTWFYNAGAYKPMTIDEWNLDAFESMNQVNYLGCVRIMLALKSYFKNKESGCWIWNISLASDFGLPYGGAYSAPKAALQNLAESLQPELKQHNIQLQVINHGFVKTRLTAKNDFAMLGLMEPKEAANKISTILNKTRFEHRFPFSLQFILGTIKRLPKSWALKLTSKALK